MSEEQTLSQKDQELLAFYDSLAGQPVPWGLLTPEEYNKKHDAWHGLCSAISGPTNPWAVFTREEAEDLLRKANGIIRATSGMAAFDGPMWHPPAGEDIQT